MLTVGELRSALDGLPDDMPVRVTPAEEPGGDFAGAEQVVISAGVDTTRDSGSSVDYRTLMIECEFPAGRYIRSQR